MTYHISLALLGLTAVYLLMYSGMTGILLVAAATMISAAFLESVEMVTAVCVVSALLYVLVFKRYIKHLEPFQDSAASIKSRIGSIQQKYSQKGQQQQQQPQGVYHKSVEGFADVSSEKKEGAPSESSSATQIVPQVDSEEVKRVTAAVDHAENEEKGHNKEEKDTECMATSRCVGWSSFASNYVQSHFQSDGKSIFRSTTVLLLLLRY